MSKSIHIGKVSVPLVDYAVGAAAVLGIRDSGKTVTSKGIAEQLLENNVPIIVFDAVGKWRWLKVAAERDNGKAYKVVVAGGREPDLPLTPHSVPEIVRAALRERIPLVIDLYSKTMSKADWRRVVQSAIHIIHYENEGGAVHVFLEEAAEFVPQKIIDGETYAEVEKLVRMGGNASVGITLINQRSQEVNKAVLDNCSTALILGCQVGDRAIQAVSSWVEKLDKDTAKVVTESLPTLPSGTAWVWTRKNLTAPSLEKMPMCRSFHPDRRTPEIVLETVKRTDTAAFVAKLADSIPKVIEEAKANDPAELKRQIADLKRKLSQAEQKQPIEVVQNPFIPAQTEEMLRDTIQSIQVFSNQFQKTAEGLMQRGHDICGELKHLLSTAQAAVKVTLPRADRIYRTAPVATRQPSPQSSNGHIGKGERKILTAIAQHTEGVTREQLTVLTGYKRSSRDTYLQRLTSGGYAAIQGDSVIATEEGVSALGSDFIPLPTGRELRIYWSGRLTGGEKAVFDMLCDHYPNPIDRETVSEQTGYQRSSRDTYIQRLTSRKLVESVGRGEVKASNQLFE